MRLIVVHSYKEALRLISLLGHSKNAVIHRLHTADLVEAKQYTPPSAQETALSRDFIWPSATSSPSPRNTVRHSMQDVMGTDTFGPRA